MTIITRAAAVAAALAFAPAAHAAVIFEVNGSFTVNGDNRGTLTGTFTTNDALNDVIAVDLRSSASGAFQATSYTDAGAIDNDQAPRTFRITFNDGASKQLQLAFSPSLSLTGASALVPASFENQQIIGAGNRILSGTVRAQVAAVPEPATWAAMLAGFALLGATMRRGARSAARVTA